MTPLSPPGLIGRSPLAQLEILFHAKFQIQLSGVSNYSLREFL